ncbi:MAG TPA: hypothetical protein VJN93_03260 [Candidatus Acidoferrum sp.]|nr:hypothetical protein [Candidatus Acidoferrum sp.]
MNATRSKTGLWAGAAVTVAVIGLAIAFAAQGPKTLAQNHERISMTHDWSNRHMVYSAPASMRQAWRLQAEPRYLHQWIRHHAEVLRRERAPRVPRPHTAPRTDWGYPMLGGGYSGVAQFPAKFTFDVTATPDCTNDFVVFNQAGLTGAAPAAASVQTFTFTNPGTPAPSGTVTLASPEVSLVLTASTTVNTGLNFQVVAGNTTTDATNLAAAITRNGAAVGVSATSSTNIVTIRALNKGAEGNLILLTKSLTGSTIPLGRLNGGSGRGNVVAFNNLYSTQGSVGGLCNQNGPSPYWSYFTGTGHAQTSVVLSTDGSKVAFVESSGTGAILRILKWKAGEGAGAGYPVAPDLTVAAGHTWTQDCLPGNSCLSSIAFSGGANDTNSSPFYDYASDTIYVGDDSGVLHKFTGIFNDTSAPAEVTTGWPISVDAGFVLTSPVFDSISRNIYVGDSSGLLSFVREVGSGIGVCTPQPCADPTTVPVGTGGSIVDSPVVDGTNGMVFAINGQDTTSNGTIVQATTDLSTSVVSFPIGGTANPGSPIYSGIFDNAYYNSSVPSIAGHMYVCGKDPGNADRPAIYQLSFDPASATLTGVGTPLTGLASADTVACSPVTEFDNPNGGGAGVEQDWIFLSFGNHASPAAPIVGPCASAPTGCLLSLNILNATTWPPASVTATASLPPDAIGAASGIVVDNISTSEQASSIYFTLRTNSTGFGPGLPSCNTRPGTGCAVKLTQSQLQ